MSRFDTVARVRQLAEARSIPITSLVKACGMNHSTLSATKARGGQLQVDTISRICDVLQITLGEFFSPTEEP